MHDSSPEWDQIATQCHLKIETEFWAPLCYSRFMHKPRENGQAQEHSKHFLYIWPHLVNKHRWEACSSSAAEPRSLNLCRCCCWVVKLYLTLCDSHVLQPTRLLCPWNSPGQNTAVACHFLLLGSSWPRDRIRVSSTAGGFFACWAIREAPGGCVILINRWINPNSRLRERWPCLNCLWPPAPGLRISTLHFYKPFVH